MFTVKFRVPDHCITVTIEHSVSEMIFLCSWDSSLETHGDLIIFPSLFSFFLLFLKSLEAEYLPFCCLSKVRVVIRVSCPEK